MPKLHHFMQVRESEMPTYVAPKVLSWAPDHDPNVINQAAASSRLPFISGHVALMPDAHFGLGATVGSVIPTDGAIIPAAVGVDIGCGMVAVETNLTSLDLPDNLDALMPLVERRVPAGVGQGHRGEIGPSAVRRLELLGKPHTELTGKQQLTADSQFATLGSGNHFVEVCLDERDHVWVVLHSGSRGIGNQLATAHIKVAKELMRDGGITLENPDLAYFMEGRPEFTAYISDMLWAQEYAYNSRALMSERTVQSLFQVVGHGGTIRTINCHHNFTERENHNGKTLWITRKGAIKADHGDLGIIPGSMGTRSYIVEGLGNQRSYNSCSHGAGRRLSRGQARRELTVSSLRQLMEGRTWNEGNAEALLDEHPLAYKDIDEVMAAQSDLVTIRHTLRQIFNYKGQDLPRKR
jgi:tRNA-splicing ligase RtcB